MSDSIPNCPKCQSEYVYQDQLLYICPDCSHEFTVAEHEQSEADSSTVITDAYGTELNDGDSVTVIKDLKVKGASSPVKAGTKVKNIRLVDSDHDIDCKIPGFGSMGLKSEFVKKLG